MFFTLFYYPYEVQAVKATGMLPHHLTDTRQGISIFRDRYCGANDAILGCYARSSFAGGHAQDDAGSIRLMALGHDWIMGGGQARGQAEHQSVVTPADGKRRQPFGLGSVIWDEVTEAGGVFGMDLRRPSIGYAERYVAVNFGGASGSPVVLGLLDQVDDHLGRDWLWNMTFEPGLKLRIHDDRCGFGLVAADGASLVARFLGARPVSIERKTTPDSKRTFQSGTTKVYPGRPYVQARFANQEHLGIYVVMAIQKGEPPCIKVVEGLSVKVGGWNWSRPFGAAIPASFRPGQSPGLCRCPSGIKGFRAV